MPRFSLSELLEAGVHFGHQSKRWNPKMKPYIFSQRNGIHIIDLVQTVKLSEKAADFLKKLVSSGDSLIFVGTKRQARGIIKEEAERCGQMYITERWPGGLITNFGSVKRTIKKYNDLWEQKRKGLHDLSKKEQSRFEKELGRFERLVGGIKDLKELPKALFVLDVRRENIAVKEASTAGIPIVAICDTNGDPEFIDYPIPGNDDAIKSIKLLVKFVADAVLEGQGGKEENKVLKEKSSGTKEKTEKDGEEKN